MDFHCIYVKLKYDEKFNVIEKIRYDGKKIRYDKDNIDKYFYLKNEMKVFNDSGVCDFFDGINNYKVCLVCYCKKEKEIR